MLTVQKPDGKWWIIHMPAGGEPECGPYSTKAEAEEDREGMGRFFRHCDEPGYVTTEQR